MVLGLLLALLQVPSSVSFVDVEAPIPKFADATNMAQQCMNGLPFDSVVLTQWDDGSVTATGNPGCAWELAQAHDVITCVNPHPCQLTWVTGWPSAPVFREY